MKNLISQDFLNDRKAEEAKFKPSYYSFDVPSNRIAISSNTHRDETRMMIVNLSTGRISHHIFKEFFYLFNENDVIIFNSTTVKPSTVQAFKAVESDSGQKETLKIQVTLLNNLGEGMFEVRVDNPRRVREDNVLHFGDNGLTAVVKESLGFGQRILRFRFDGGVNELESELASLCSPLLADYSGTLKEGEVPEPQTKKKPVSGNQYRRSSEGYRHYQTIYASGGSSIVTPSAGLHFGKSTMLRGELRGVDFAYINVDCGLGDRTPIDIDTSLKRQSYPCEYISIDEAAVTTINAGKHRICAVGTSVLRAMETAYDLKGKARPYAGIASNFLYPGYIFGSKVNCLLTGLHFGEANPNLMAVCAFARSRELIFKAYKKAIKMGYYFGEYGDAMLIVA